MNISECQSLLNNSVTGSRSRHSGGKGTGQGDCAEGLSIFRRRTAACRWRAQNRAWRSCSRSRCNRSNRARRRCSAAGIGPPAASSCLQSAALASWCSPASAGASHRGCLPGAPPGRGSERGMLSATDSAGQPRTSQPTAPARLLSHCSSPAPTACAHDGDTGASGGRRPLDRDALAIGRRVLNKPNDSYLPAPPNACRSPDSALPPKSRHL